MHYYWGNNVSYKALQHFGRVLFQGYVCGLSRKDVDRYKPQDTWCKLCVSFFINLSFLDVEMTLQKCGN